MTANRHLGRSWMAGGDPVVRWPEVPQRALMSGMLLSGMSPTPDTDEPVVEEKPGNEPEDLTGRALRLRIRQQELLAELGVLALQRTSFIDMLDHTARVTAEGLGAEYCKVMEY